LQNNNLRAINKLQPKQQGSLQTSVTNRELPSLQGNNLRAAINKRHFKQAEVFKPAIKPRRLYATVLASSLMEFEGYQEPRYYERGYLLGSELSRS
jgi:hypothetical protein